MHLLELFFKKTFTTQKILYFKYCKNSNTISEAQITTMTEYGRTKMTEYGRITHLLYFIGFGMLIFPCYILPLYGFHQTILTLINYTAIIIHLVYFFIVILRPPTHVTKGLANAETPSDVFYHYIDDSECPCGHVPKEKNLVHCNMTNGCLEGYHSYSNWFGYVIYKDNRLKSLILHCTGALAYTFQFIFSVRLIDIAREYIISYSKTLMLPVIQLPLNLGIFYIIILFTGMIAFNVTAKSILGIYLYSTGKRMYTEKKSVILYLAKREF